MGLLDRFRGKKCDEIGAPVAGEAVALSEVKDPAFAGEMLGRGMAIRPSSGCIAAPCDAVVDTMFASGHAVSLKTDAGAELLIHVGLDTVKLGGRYFTAYCRCGERVQKGQTLIRFDKDAIAAEGYDVMTPVVVCNAGDYPCFEAVTGRRVAQGETVIRLCR